MSQRFYGMQKSTNINSSIFSQWLDKFSCLLAYCFIVKSWYRRNSFIISFLIFNEEHRFRLKIYRKFSISQIPYLSQQIFAKDLGISPKYASFFCFFPKLRRM